MAIDSVLDNVQIELKEADSCTRNATVKYTAEQVDAVFKDAVKEAGKYAQLPGFRKGKAPAALILSKYKDYILDDVTKMLQQGGLRKVSVTPDLDIVSFGAMVAMTPLITIQVMGLLSRMKQRQMLQRARHELLQIEDDMIFYDEEVSG